MMILEKKDPFDTTDPPRFTLDKSITIIEYSSTDDVIELHCSINTPRLVLEDHPVQSCNAFLCAVKKVDLPHVYIAVKFLDNEKIYVYTPQKQPADMTEYRKTMQDAVEFVEVAGLMMNNVTLEGPPEYREKVIRKVPVLSRTEI